MSTAPIAQGPVDVNVSRRVRTLGEIIEQATRTGETQTMTQEEWDSFLADYRADIGPKIDRIRAEQRQAWAQARHLIVDC